MSFAVQSNVDLIEQEIAAGYINVQRHPSLPFRILNYSQRAQFDWHWNEATLQCRGLIVDDDWNVLQRPFPKFFSYEQLNGIVPNEPFEVFEKMDGSLGILYWDRNGPWIATRGSFTSEQANMGGMILHLKYSHVLNSLNPEFTYLFEIIHPGNRIVVNYGDMQDLVLLAVIETATGIEQPLPSIGFPVVKRYDGIDDFAELLQKQESNREGFVVRFQSGQRVKLKFDEYKRLHKLLTGVSAVHVWDLMRNSQPVDELLERVPDEYYRWVQGVMSHLRVRYTAIECSAKIELHDAPKNVTRKELAEYIKTCHNPSVCFAMLDEKPYADKIWRMIKPTGNVFRTDSDI